MPMPFAAGQRLLSQWPCVPLQSAQGQCAADSEEPFPGGAVPAEAPVSTVPCPHLRLLPAPPWGAAAQPSRGHVAFVPPGIQAAEASQSNRANGSDLWCSNCNRDLSGNEILSIEERAFEPLPFLKLL